ncbi:MAG: ABC transporter substrate-binding protein [Anaerolineae bacterium]
MKMRVLLSVLVLLLVMMSAMAQDDEPVEIEFVHIFGGDGDIRADVIQAIADDFMALNPNVTVTVRSTSPDYDELFNAALLAASQGSAPELVQVVEGLTQQAADSGFFLPITELASEEQLASHNDILPVLTEYYSLEGQQWSLPWNSSNPVLYYNKSITDALGLEISSTEPLTFDELTAICEQVNAAIESGALEAGACANWSASAWFIEQWLAMQGALMLNNDNGRTARATEVVFNSPELLNIFNWWQSMAESGYWTFGGATNDLNSEGISFLTTPTVFHINSTAGLTLFQNAFNNFGLELGVAPLLIPNEDATNGVTIGGASVWVTAGHSEAETQAAVDFAYFLTSVENDIRWHQGSGYFPIHAASIAALEAGGLWVDADGNPTTPDAEGATEVAWFETFPSFYIAVRQLQESGSSYANAGPSAGPLNEVRNILQDALVSVVDGGFSPEEALDAATTRANAVLEEYNSVVTGS